LFAAARYPGPRVREKLAALLVFSCRNFLLCRFSIVEFTSPCYSSDPAVVAAVAQRRDRVDKVASPTVGVNFLLDLCVVVRDLTL